MVKSVCYWLIVVEGRLWSNIKGYNEFSCLLFFWEVEYKNIEVRYREGDEEKLCYEL